MSRRGLEQENDRLLKENQALADQLKATQQSIAAEKGPPKNTRVCYQRAGEDFCRPGRVMSDGFTERVPGPAGSTLCHALIEYGEPPWAPKAAHGFQTDRPYDTLGRPNTWHDPRDCPRDKGAGCPFADQPHYPAVVEAP